MNTVDVLDEVSNSLMFIRYETPNRLINLGTNQHTIIRYHQMWLEADKNLGVFINQEKAYWTYKDSYIERGQ